MATYSIDPVTVDIGDFTHRHGGTAIIQVVDDAGTPSILFDPNNVDTFYSYDLIPPIADLEILTLVRNSRTGNSGNGALAVARMGETGFSLYGSGLRNAADTTIISYASGSVAGLSNVTRSIDTTAYTWQRFRLTGNTLEQKTWQGAPEDEPAAYQAIITNTDVTASGLVGVGMRGASTILDQSYYAWLSVGTDGDAAPFPSTSPSITSVDGDNAVTQYQQPVTIALAGFTETITSVTINGVSCTIGSQVVGTSVDVVIPGTLSTGTYDVVVSGATESATLTGVSYTQTHEFLVPDTLADSNSFASGQSWTANSYATIVSAPADGTLDTSGADWLVVDVADVYTPDPGFTGADSVTIGILYSDGTTDSWVATITVLPTPTNLQATNITSNSVRLTWERG